MEACWFFFSLSLSRTLPPKLPLQFTLHMRTPVWVLMRNRMKCWGFFLHFFPASTPSSPPLTSLQSSGVMRTRLPHRGAFLFKLAKCVSLHFVVGFVVVIVVISAVVSSSSLHFRRLIFFSSSISHTSSLPMCVCVCVLAAKRTHFMAFVKSLPF